MLRYLRENTGNWIIKIFLGIIVIVFVFLGIGTMSANKEDTIGKIDDMPITFKEYERAYKTIYSQMQASFGRNLNDEILKMLNLKQQALDAVIEQKLVLSKADSMGIIISSEELQEHISSFEPFLDNGSFSLSKYKRVLAQNSVSPSDFELSQINALKTQKLKNIVLGFVSVSDAEAKEWYVYQNTKAAVNYIVFDPTLYSNISPDDKQIRKFYKENKEKYKSNAKKQARYLRFKFADYKDKTNIKTEQIKKYYNENKEQFVTPEQVEVRHILIKLDQDASEDEVKQAKNKAEQIYEKAFKGENFEKLAKQYSQGPSKDEGGYLGKFDKYTMVKPFSDKAFSMKENEISKPVKTRFGFHIIKLIKKHDSITKTLKQISKEIKAILEQDKIQSLAYDDADKALNSILDGDDFDQAALLAKTKVIKTKEFDKSGTGLDFSGSSKFAITAFELSSNETSEIIEIDDSYYLIEIIKTIDPAVLSFDLVKEDAKNDLVVQLQNEKAEQSAKDYAKKGLKADNIQELAKKNKLTLQTTDLFKRNAYIQDIGNSSEFISAAFALNNKDNKIHPEPIVVQSKYYIIGFKEKQIPVFENVDDIDTFKNEIINKKQIQSYQAWIQELKSNSEITYDPEILN